MSLLHTETRRSLARLVNELIFCYCRTPVPLFPRFLRAVLYGASVFVSFFLMLVFMTYNVCPTHPISSCSRSMTGSLTLPTCCYPQPLGLPHLGCCPRSEYWPLRIRCLHGRRRCTGWRRRWQGHGVSLIAHNTHFLTRAVYIVAEYDVQRSSSVVQELRPTSSKSQDGLRRIGC